MARTHQFIQVDFHRFKAFQSFRFRLRHFNILVGPNNAGKSTILTAFRILAAAMRKAGSRSPDMVRGPQGPVLGHSIELRAISVAEENLFYNYDASEPATVRFLISNRNELTLYFPEQGSCYLIPDANGKQPRSPSAFRTHFNCLIGFVPILGPVEHEESLYEREAARLALFNYRAARNFRNIWYHYPERFDEFRETLRRTWPGMDIERPKVHLSGQKPKLYMFCPEERIPREIFWAGFGFQVWCQMLTHLIQSRDVALFLIDEPDIYLHSDLQRQLLGLLRNLGPDILIATHSIEIITEAEADEIVLINKSRRTARRIKQPAELDQIFTLLGSNLNPVLTQLAKTRRAVFVEGKDFQILSRFAQRLGLTQVANRSEFAVIPVEGFNPDRIRTLKKGIETTLGGKILAAAVLDKDYRCDGECSAIVRECKLFCNYVTIHECKEIENFLLVPEAIDRAAATRISDRARRTGKEATYAENASMALEDFCATKKSYVTAQYLANRRRFERANSRGIDESTINEIALQELDEDWQDVASRLRIIPGKEALAAVNQYLQKVYGVTVTPTAIIDAMQMDEISSKLVHLLQEISKFSRSEIGDQVLRQ